MQEKPIKNKAASVRVRLLDLAKRRNQNYNALLLHFFQERFLARLGASPLKNHFILKGGYLLLARHVSPFRPTIDIDVLGVQIDNHPDTLKRHIQQIAAIDLGDGVQFETDNISVQTIKEDANYAGLRFIFRARLDTINNKMQMDIGFGDSVPDGFINAHLPTMLDDLSAPAILHYPFESIIAEKFQALVYLGYAGSRMKDIYDILFLVINNPFDMQKLQAAITATFAQRQTDINKRVFIYSQEYIAAKQPMWNGFLRKINQAGSKKFTTAINELKTFMEPIFSESRIPSRWHPESWRWEPIE